MRNSLNPKPSSNDKARDVLSEHLPIKTIPQGPIEPLTSIANQAPEISRTLNNNYYGLLFIIFLLAVIFTGLSLM